MGKILLSMASFWFEATVLLKLFKSAILLIVTSVASGRLQEGFRKASGGFSNVLEMAQNTTKGLLKHSEDFVKDRK